MHHVQHLANLNFESPRLRKEEEILAMASEAAEEAQAPLGLLDQPVLIEGKRKRKATKQYNIEASVPKKRVAAKHVGSGTKLQDIPSVEQTLTEKFKADDLRMLYKLCFEVTGKTTTLKKELKQFQGFGFDKDSTEYKKKQAQLNKLNKSVLAAQFCAPLCLKDKGTKEEVINRIMEFLLCPTDSGEAVVSDVKKKVQQKKKKGKDKELTDSDHKETTAEDDVEDNEEPSTTATADKDDKEEEEEKEDKGEE